MLVVVDAWCDESGGWAAGEAGAVGGLGWLVGGGEMRAPGGKKGRVEGVVDGVFLRLGLGGVVLVILASHLSCAVVRSWFRDVDIRRYCQMSCRGLWT